MSHAEAMQWQRYLKKYNLGQASKGDRWYLSHIAFFLSQVAGHKIKFDAFAYKEPDPVDLETAMEKWH